MFPRRRCAEEHGLAAVAATGVHDSAHGSAAAAVAVAKDVHLGKQLALVQPVHEPLLLRQRIGRPAWQPGDVDGRERGRREARQQAGLVHVDQLVQPAARRDAREAREQRRGGQPSGNAKHCSAKRTRSCRQLRLTLRQPKSHAAHRARREPRHNLGAPPVGREGGTSAGRQGPARPRAGAERVRREHGRPEGQP